MPILILDLDETVFVVKSLAQNIHPIHTRSADIVGAKTVFDSVVYQLTVNIINPEQLSELINTACTEYDGVIILTSGFWDPSVRDLLEPYLDLSEEAAEQFKKCRFHSVLTDSKLFNIAPDTLREMDKYARIRMLIDYYPELADLFLMLLDDYSKHVDAVLKADNKMIGAVLATTDTEQKDFYQHTLNVLQQGKKQELLLENKADMLDESHRFFKSRKLDSDLNSSPVSEPALSTATPTT